MKLKNWLPGLLAGALISSATAFIQADRIGLNGVMVHYGLVLAPAIVLIVQRYLMSYYQSRIAGMAYAFGWGLVTIRFAIPNSEGDLALAGVWSSMVYIGTCVLLLSSSAMISPRTKMGVVE